MSDVARLFDEHHQSLYRYLVRFSGDADVAADAAQEAFVRLVERPLSAPVERAWLFKVATNFVLEQTRTRARRTHLLDGSPERAPMADPPRDAHELVEATDRQTVVRGGLASLGEKERVLLQNPQQGTYVLRVVNFASVAPTWTMTAALYDVAEQTVGGLIESWTLLCEKDGRVLARVPVVVDRGGQAKVNLRACQAG